MVAERRHKRTLAYTLVALSVLIVSGACVSFYLARHYRRIILLRLPEWAAAASDSLYRVSVGNVSINLLNRRVKAVEVHIYPDTAQVRRLRLRGRAPALLFDIRVPEIRVRGVRWENLVLDKELSCDQFSVLNPVIRVRRDPPPAAVDTGAVVPRRPGVSLSLISARHLEMLHAELSYLHNGDHDSFYCAAKNGSFVFDDWELRPGHPPDPARFLNAQSATVALSSFLFYKPRGLYFMKADSLVFTSADSQCRFRQLVIRPVVDRQEFARRMGQKDQYDVLFETLALERLNWNALMDGKGLDASVLRLGKPEVHIYMDRTAAPNAESKMGRFPQQLLLRLSLPLEIDSALISEGRFVYAERSDKTRRDGQVTFDDISGSIANITNQPERIRRQPVIRARFRSLFMQSSPLDATFLFQLSDFSGAFSLDAVLKQVEAYQLRETAQALAMADVSSLEVPQLSFHLQGDEESAQGDFEFLYHDLKIKIQKVNQQTNVLQNRPFLSFLANAVLLYPDNPMPGEAVRKVSVVQLRDPYKSFFNLIWKSVFQALGKTALRGDEAMKMVEEQQVRNAGKAGRKAARMERRKERLERREKRKAAKMAAIGKR